MLKRQTYGRANLDKRHVTVAAVDAQQQVVFSPHKIAVSKFEAWALLNLTPGDQVAIEATSNAWDFYDQLLPLVADVSVANCHQFTLDPTCAPCFASDYLPARKRILGLDKSYN